MRIVYRNAHKFSATRVQQQNGRGRQRGTWATAPYLGPLIGDALGNEAVVQLLHFKGQGSRSREPVLQPLQTAADLRSDTAPASPASVRAEHLGELYAALPPAPLRRRHFCGCFAGLVAARLPEDGHITQSSRNPPTLRTQGSGGGTFIQLVLFSAASPFPMLDRWKRRSTCSP